MNDDDAETEFERYMDDLSTVPPQPPRWEDE